MTTYTILSRQTPYRGEINELALEQFATSIAALAGDATAPLVALERALNGFAENLNRLHGGHCYDTDRLLQEKASACGYPDVAEFRKRLERLIGERMIELHVSRLSAAARQRRYSA